ncbi:hypothetical protein EMPS_08683 [Entomortierella parvispora]|uniref:Domain of unknown function at the cortex 1 domain-containing protein n=1 Tax=Entomortierella parvispora TaxID=205924 RepID=A0A9P3HGH6_9FUNG|nr:hypothetical protein EMPS_08683 [Entomortierella parvispora]
MSTVIEHNSIRYRVKVSVGPNAKCLQVLNVNDDDHPILIQSDDFVGHVIFRIRGQDQIHGYAEGQQQDGFSLLPDSPWFHSPDGVSGATGKKGKKDNSHINSLQIQGRFKRAWSGDQVVFATTFDRPLKLPSLTSVAIKFFKTLDPGLQIDIQGDQPYFISPLLAAMDVVHITPSSADTPSWPSHRGEHISEDVTLALQATFAAAATSTAVSKGDKEEQNTLHKTIKKLALDPAARKNYYAKTKNLTLHKFSPDQEYGLGLFNGFLDCAKFSVKLPGFGLDLFKYFDGQPITYSVRTQDASVTFLVVVIDLVPVVDSAPAQLSDL